MTLRNEQRPETVVLAWILADEVVFDDRYSEFTCSTTEDEPTEGNVELPSVGFYVYQIYYQDSLTNLDPEDEAVIKLAEIGRLKVYE